MEIKISDLTEENRALSDLANSQAEQTEAQKKAIQLIADNQIKYVIHTVEPGESLVSICENYNIDYNSCKNIIFAVNGIKNPNTVNPGQKIILPQFNNP